MNRFAIQTAVWLDETTKALRQIRDYANHLSQCNFEEGDNVSKDAYSKVRGVINDAINKILAEIEKL